MLSPDCAITELVMELMYVHYRRHSSAANNSRSHLSGFIYNIRSFKYCSCHCTAKQWEQQC